MAQETLPSLKAGDLGIVAEIDGIQLAAKRLADMGFVRGAQITMIQPGMPCIVRIDGRCVGLGGVHQESIQLIAAPEG